MSYGISILNENNQILIDQDYKNAGILTRGFGVVGETGLFITYTRTEDGFASWSSVPMMCAVKPRTGSGIAIATYISGLEGTGGFTGDLYACYPRQYHSDIEFAMFGTENIQWQDNDDYGLRIANGSGETVYDSRRTYLEVVDVVSIAKPNLNLQPQTYNHAPLNDAFYVMSSFSGFMRNGYNLIKVGIRQNSSTSMSVVPFIISTGGVSYLYNAYQATKILVCKLPPL